MKKILIIVFYLFNVHTIYAQKNSCTCITKEGVNSLSVEGIVTYKGTSKALGHTYEVNLIFENQSKCSLQIENILMGTNDIKPNILLTIDAKNRKKTFKKILQLNKLLEPSIGLDDALFADLLVSYTLNKTACFNEVTVGYKSLIKK